MRPKEICRGPKWELAVKRDMRRNELKMLDIAKRASAIRVGCHISHSSLGREPLYWKKQQVHKMRGTRVTTEKSSAHGLVSLDLQDSQKCERGQPYGGLLIMT